MSLEQLIFTWKGQHLVLTLFASKVRTKLKSTLLIFIFPGYAMLSSLLSLSKKKISFTKRIGRKCRLI